MAGREDIPWTEADVGRAIAMRVAGMSGSEIGKAIGRSASSVNSKLNNSRSMRAMPAAARGAAREAAVVVKPKGRHAWDSERRGLFGWALPPGHPITCEAIGLKPWRAALSEPAHD